MVTANLRKKAFNWLTARFGPLSSTAGNMATDRRGAGGGVEKSTS